MLFNYKEDVEKIVTIENDDELTQCIEFVKLLVETIDNYLQNNSTHERNYYNEQNIIEYQDKVLNKYSVSFKDI